MKLLSKYNRVNLLTTIIVMLTTGLIYYQVISVILTSQVDKDLEVEESEVFESVATNHKLPQVFSSNDQQITFKMVPAGSVKRRFINTVYHKKKKGEDREEDESGRGLISAVTVAGKYYQIQIVESKVETEDLIQIIFGITIGVILFLLLVLFIINRLIINKLWRPFYTILGELRLFSLTDQKEIPDLKTTTDEFKELNNAVAAMSSRVRKDYKELKTFTENASHELLTPIAVINSKLDSLLQTDRFNEQQSKLLNDLYNAVSRLSRLNQSMLLLAKIENRLLHDRQTVNLKVLIEEMIVQFEEIFSDKNLQITCNLQNKELKTSQYMVEILLNNLFGNAIRHNRYGGQILIDLEANSLVMKNTGETNALHGEQIFTRFHKSASSEGTGLGLTISRQICENFGATINYTFQSPYHIFTVNFN
jgi:signal transduction histidine kinase